MDAQKALLLAELGGVIQDERVLEAIRRVPREAFVAPRHRAMAYGNVALPIEAGQTISQPFIVAIMTEALALTGTETVLEIGTGSGYQAAVLSELAASVVSVERAPELAASARERLAALGYGNVTVHEARDDVLGWPEDAPYDGILVTAAAPRVPRSLLAQLRDGGRLIVPVGARDEQELLAVQPRGGTVETRHICYCRFVPLIGPEGWPNDGGGETTDGAGSD